MQDKSLTAYDVADHYSDEYFADLSARYRKRNRFARRRIANVFSLLPELRGKRFFDVGCGMGTFTLETARRGAVSVGVDLARPGIAAARRVANEEGMERASFVLADAAVLPIKSDSIDVALAADFTEHLDDDTLMRVFNELHRVIKQGAALIIYTPQATHVFERLRSAGIMKQEPSHIGVRSGDELKFAAQQAGFVVERIRYLPSHLPVFNLLEQALGRWVPLLRRRIGLVARKA